MFSIYSFKDYSIDELSRASYRNTANSSCYSSASTDLFKVSFFLPSRQTPLEFRDIISTMKGVFDQDVCLIFHSSKARLCAAHHALMEHNAAAIKQLFGINQINLPMLFF